jgi:hypothetical protein
VQGRIDSINDIRGDGQERTFFRHTPFYETELGKQNGEDALFNHEVRTPHTSFYTTEDSHLLLVSFDADVNAVDRLIQEKILPLLHKQHDYPRPAKA